MGLSRILLAIRLNWNKNSRWVGRSAVAGLAGGYGVSYINGSSGIEEFLMTPIVFMVAVAGAGFYQYYHPEDEDGQSGTYTSKRIDRDRNT